VYARSLAVVAGRGTRLRLVSVTAKQRVVLSALRDARHERTGRPSARVRRRSVCPASWHDRPDLVTQALWLLQGHDAPRRVTGSGSAAFRWERPSYGAVHRPPPARRRGRALGRAATLARREPVAACVPVGGPLAKQPKSYARGSDNARRLSGPDAHAKALETRRHQRKRAQAAPTVVGKTNVRGRPLRHHGPTDHHHLEEFKNQTIEPLRKPGHLKVRDVAQLAVRPTRSPRVCWPSCVAAIWFPSYGSRRCKTRAVRAPAPADAPAADACLGDEPHLRAAHPVGCRALPAELPVVQPRCPALGPRARRARARPGSGERSRSTKSGSSSGRRRTLHRAITGAERARAARRGTLAAARRGPGQIAPRVVPPASRSAAARPSARLPDQTAGRRSARGRRGTPAHRRARRWTARPRPSR
jgi:hypothetical protein